MPRPGPHEALSLAPPPRPTIVRAVREAEILTHSKRSGWNPAGNRNVLSVPVRLRQRRHNIRRGGRVVEGARLESVYRGNPIAGSNPAPSATVCRQHATPGVRRCGLRLRASMRSKHAGGAHAPWRCFGSSAWSLATVSRGSSMPNSRIPGTMTTARGRPLSSMAKRSASRRPTKRPPNRPACSRSTQLPRRSLPMKMRDDLRKGRKGGPQDS
jgi:hypothetical protein